MPDEKIADLIERVERLDGPDRETDCLIWAEFGNRDVRWDGNKLLARYRKPPHDECWLGTIDPGRVQRNFSAMSGFVPPIPFFTDSLDACLALVERVSKGAEYEISTLYGIAQVTLPLNASDPDECQTARRPDGNVPLAVLSALLRSIQADR